MDKLLITPSALMTPSIMSDEELHKLKEIVDEEIKKRTEARKKELANEMITAMWRFRNEFPAAECWVEYAYTDCDPVEDVGKTITINFCISS